MRPFRSPFRLPTFLCLAFLPLQSQGFEVIKDINKEPVEKLVIFEKGETFPAPFVC
ncbi:MAG: hypothetical protein ACOYM3_26910 [Terrimicrobiaceae bacterium]